MAGLSLKRQAHLLARRKWRLRKLSDSLAFLKPWLSPEEYLSLSSRVGTSISELHKKEIAAYLDYEISQEYKRKALALRRAEMKAEKSCQACKQSSLCK